MKTRLGFAVMLALGASPAMAVDWNLEPKIALSGVYNDNNRLTDVPGNEIKVSGALLDAQLAVVADTPQTSFRFVPRLRSTLYPGDEDEETDDQFLLFGLDHKTQRSASSLDIRYSSMETRGRYFPNAEIEQDADLGNPDRGESIGRVGIRNREDRLSITPAVSFEITQRQSLEFAVDYLDTSFDIQVPGDKEDYEDLYGTVALRHSLSEAKSIAVRMGYGTYDPSAGDSTDTQSLDVEWLNRISETAQWYVRVGGNRAEYETGTGGDKEWESGFTGGAGVRWSLELTDIWLDVSQNFDPNAGGDVVNREQLRVQLTRKLGPMTRLLVSGRLIKDSDPGAGGDSTGRTYARGTLGFDWRIAQAWTVFGAYDYTLREYDDGAANDAEANAVNIGIVYEPKRL